MTWHDKSRAADDETVTSCPEELYGIVTFTNDLETVGLEREEVTELVQTEYDNEPAEWVTYVRAGLGSEGSASGTSPYYNTPPGSIYPIIDTETREWFGVETSYERAQKLAVNEGDDVVFVKYTRNDKVDLRTWSDREQQEPGRSDELGFLNLGKDRYPPHERMNEKAYTFYEREVGEDSHMLRS